MQYCFKAAAKYLRRPPEIEADDGQANPSVFVMCNTSLASGRVYAACQRCGLSVIRTINVIPVERKPPLFTVFIIVLDSWLQCRPDLFPRLADVVPIAEPDAPADLLRVTRVEASVRGEEVGTLTVRQAGSGAHTAEYQALLRDLGKPSSADKESYDVTEVANNVVAAAGGGS